MKFSVPISSLSPRGLKNLIFSFYNKCELLSKATDGNFYVSRDFCYSIGDGIFKEQILDKIIVQQEEKQAKVQGETQEADKSALLGIRIENRTDDYDGDLVFTGFNQSEEQEETAQVDAVQEDAAQEDAVQVADKPNFDPELENTPTVGTETAANNNNNNNAVEGQAGELAEEPASEASTQTPETPLVTLCGATIRDRAISVFLDYLVHHCNDVKHVALEDEETRTEVAKNEKFAMRAWFTQLGWKGKEDNELRSYFYDNLEGNTAFRTEEDHARWAARWQPKYFEKHPEMKWVLEETNPLSQRNQIEAEVESEPASEPEPEQEQESEVASESDQHMAEEVGEYVAASNLSNLIFPDKTVPDEAAEDSEKSAIAASAEVAEAVSDTALATVGTEESAEVDQEAATETVAEAEAEKAEESEIKNNA